LLHIRPGIVSVSVLLLGSWFSWAQPPIPMENCVPCDVVFYVHCEGLDKSADSFRTTAVKEMLRDADVKAFGEALIGVLAHMIKERAPGLPLTAQDIRLLANCETAFAVLDVTGPLTEVALLVRPRGRAQEVRRLAERLLKAASADPKEPVSEEQVLGVRFRRRAGVCIAWVGDDLVVTRAAGAMRKILTTIWGRSPPIGRDARFRALSEKTRAHEAFLQVHFSVEHLTKQFVPTSRDPKRRRKMLNETGLVCFKAAQLVVAPEPPGIRSTLYVSTPAPRWGLPVLIPHGPLEETRMLLGVPQDVESFSMLRYDAAGAHDRLLVLLKLTNEEWLLENRVRYVRDLMGLDVRGDVLGALGDEVMIRSYGSDAAGSELSVASIPVKDPAVIWSWFGKLEKADKRWRREIAESLPEEGPFRSPFTFKTYRYKGIRIGRVHIADRPPYDYWFALHAGRLLVGWVPGAVEKAMDAPVVSPRPIFVDREFTKLRSRVAGSPTLLSYRSFQRGFAPKWDQVRFLGFITRFLTPRGHPVRRLSSSWPPANVLAPHLFGSIAAASWDKDGLKLESYGPAGGFLNPPVGVLPFAVMGWAGDWLVAGMLKQRWQRWQWLCRISVQQLALALRQYEGEQEGYPESLVTLLQRGYITTPWTFICPFTRKEPSKDLPKDLRKITKEQFEAFNCYVMLRDPPLRWRRSDSILVHDKAGNHPGGGRCCATIDAKVVCYDSEEAFQKAMAEERRRRREPVLKCRENLHEGEWPDDLDELVYEKYLPDRETLRCPRGASYTFVDPGNKGFQPTDIIVYEPSGMHIGGRNVLLFNQEVQWLSEDEFTKRKAKQKRE